MKYSAKTIPIVHVMMVRKVFFPFEDELNMPWIDGGKICATQCEVEDVGISEARMDYDEEVIDVSHGIFNLSNDVLMIKEIPDEIMIFPSRRWRNFRKGEDIIGLPSHDDPLLFIGNPCKIWRIEKGICVIREPSFLIKSGMELGY